jgi:formylglycine-generating enzyme required for sulfatase activity
MLSATAAPQVTNVRASQRAGTKLVDVLYDLSGSGPMTVRMEVSADNGVSFTIPAVTLTGAAGSGVTAGINKALVWNAGSDFDDRWSPQTKVKVVAFENTLPVAPAGMEYIPAGAVLTPTASATVSAFFMDRYEVTRLLWSSVRVLGATSGYGIAAGDLNADNHPVTSVSWYDCLKWANARSEREGLTPCYYTDVAQTQVYRTGNVNVLNTMVKWSANGYRLPTEAEWERGARGGSVDTNYWWGNTMTSADGNFASSGDPFGGNSIQTTPVGYYNGTTYNLAGGGTFATNNRKNAFGLYDVSGNVWEWCWDWYGSTYPSSGSNPQGPSSGQNRVLRGGSWNNPTSDATLANRGSNHPSSTYTSNGLRCARGL